MTTTEMKISDIKPNPNNPRLIKDEKFKRLVESVKKFPEMLRLRPIVVNEADVIIGGNMRWKAAKEAGYKTVPVTKAVGLTEEQQREFIIKDNVGFGEWDWEMLANEWESEKLEEWGVDVPKWSHGHDANNMTEDDVDITEQFDPVGTAKGTQRVVFIFDGQEEAESYLKSIRVEYKKESYAWQVNMLTRSIL